MNAGSEKISPGAGGFAVGHHHHDIGLRGDDGFIAHLLVAGKALRNIDASGERDDGVGRRAGAGDKWSAALHCDDKQHVRAFMHLGAECGQLRETPRDGFDKRRGLCIRAGEMAERRDLALHAFRGEIIR